MSLRYCGDDHHSLTTVESSTKVGYRSPHLLPRRTPGHRSPELLAGSLTQGARKLLTSALAWDAEEDDAATAASKVHRSSGRRLHMGKRIIDTSAPIESVSIQE